MELTNEIVNTDGIYSDDTPSDIILREELFDEISNEISQAVYSIILDRIDGDTDEKSCNIADSIAEKTTQIAHSEIILSSENGTKFM